MKDATSRSWDDAIEALKRAIKDLSAAVGSGQPSGTDEREAASRLKSDVSRLEQSAADLVSRLRGGIEQQRADIESSIDRERIERSADQLKTSLEELASQAGAVTSRMAAAADSSLKQADPEIKSAIGALDDVITSSATWVRASLDPKRDRRGNLPSEGRPPLDDL